MCDGSSHDVTKSMEMCVSLCTSLIVHGSKGDQKASARKTERSENANQFCQTHLAIRDANAMRGSSGSRHRFRISVSEGCVRGRHIGSLTIERGIADEAPLVMSSPSQV